MPLYLGQDIIKINLNDITYRLNLDITIPTVIDNILSSSDKYILQDSNGVYLIPQLATADKSIMPSNDYIL